MNNRRTPHLMGFVIVLLGISGCAGVPKEKTAPCKRPANAMAYAADPRTDCGPMHAVNGNPVAAFKAIEAIGND
jgi:hypothetical protein